jgi:hypothetical protein
MCKTGYSLEKITKDNNNVKKNTFKKIFFPHCILFEILWFKFKVQNTLSEMEGINMAAKFSLAMSHQ